MSSKNKPSLLVVAAHPGDFVWRSAGSIALHLAAGWRVKIVCASLGVKGEAGLLWKEPEATLDSVAAIRRQEAKAAADLLEAEIVFLELDDYPLVPKTSDIIFLSKLMREFNPSVILTHAPKDPSSIDHVNTSEMVMQARCFATRCTSWSSPRSKESIKHAEAFQRAFPSIVTQFESDM